MHRGTPLYGQPAWWGDGDADDQQPGRPEERSSDRKKEKAETGITRKIQKSYRSFDLAEDWVSDSYS